MENVTGKKHRKNPRKRPGKNSALLTLWAGEFSARIGVTIFQIALLWYLLERTESSVVTGLVSMISYLPAVVVGLWAGVFVDRLDYRRVMMGANVARSALAAGIPLFFLAGWLPVAAIGLLGFLLTSATAFFNPARDSIIPLLARKEELVSANSLVQSAWQFSLVIGPMLAAGALHLMQARSIDTVFLFFLVSGAFLLSQSILFGLGRQGRMGGDASLAGFAAEFKAGLSYLRSEKRIWWIWIITAVDNFFLMGAVFVGIPVYVKSYLGGTGTDYAVLEGTYAGGMIVFTLLISRYGKRADPLRVLFLAIIYDGLSYVPLLWVNTLPGALLVILIHSLGIPAITIYRITALHSIVPQHMQGRVFSYINLAVDGMTALSMGVVGIVLLWLPPNWLFAAIGLLAASTGVAGLMLPVFRKK